MPARIAEFDGVAGRTRQQPQESRQSIEIDPEAGRKLEKRRSQPVAQWRHASIDQGDRLADVLQLLGLSDVARRLPCKQEPRRGLQAPRLDGRLAGQSVERTVDLDGAKLRRVVAQAIGLADLLRIEKAGPVRIDPA